MAKWFLLALLGTLAAHFIWFSIWAFVEWLVPSRKKLKAAREEDRHIILSLKAELCDIYKEMVALQKSEAKLRMVAEMTRSANRNVNAQVTEALK